MATTLVQFSSNSITGGTTLNTTLNGVGAGNTLIAVIRVTTPNTTLTTGDGNGTGNVYVAGARQVFTNYDGTHDGVVQIDYCVASASGTVTVSVVAGVSATIWVDLLEVSGLPAGFNFTSGTLAETSTGTAHTSASPSLSIATGNNFTVAGWLFSAIAGGVLPLTPGSNYTLTLNGPSQIHGAEYATVLSNTSNNAPFTSQASIKSFGVMANFGPAPPIPQQAFLFFLDDWI